jgi:hypothetical protein
MINDHAIPLHWCRHKLQMALAIYFSSVLHILAVVSAWRLFFFHFQDTVKLNPSTDFYKKLALDCAADQVSVDIFQLSSQYADCSSLSKYNFC